MTTNIATDMPLIERLRALLQKPPITFENVLHAVEQAAGVKFADAFEALRIYGHRHLTSHEPVLWGTLCALAPDVALLEMKGNYALLRRTSCTEKQEVFLATWITPMQENAVRPNLIWSATETIVLSPEGTLLIGTHAWKDTIKPWLERWLPISPPEPKSE